MFVSGAEENLNYDVTIKITTSGTNDEYERIIDVEKKVEAAAFVPLYDDQDIATEEEANAGDDESTDDTEEFNTQS